MSGGTDPDNDNCGGGCYYDGRSCCLDQVTVTKDGEEFYELEPLPHPSNFETCIAAVNASMLFTTGLGDNEDESYLFYNDTGEWVPVPNMPTGRNLFSCGVVRDLQKGQTEVVVVGGQEQYVSGYIDTVEIFNVEERSWRTGKCFKHS